MVTDILKQLGPAMVGIRWVTLAGRKMLWIAGVFPRTRWAVSMIYAVVTSARGEVPKWVGRRREMDDTRDKAALAAVKALMWASTLLQIFSRGLVRSVNLNQPEIQF